MGRPALGTLPAELQRGRPGRTARFLRGRLHRSVARRSVAPPRFTARRTIRGGPGSAKITCQIHFIRRRRRLIFPNVAQGLTGSWTSGGARWEPGRLPLPGSLKRIRQESMQINASLSPAALDRPANRLLRLAAGKVRRIAETWGPSRGTPVFTVGGQYTTRGWTEWTQGFQYGCAILAFDATGDARPAGTGPARHACGSWPRTSPTPASTTTASTTSPPTATSAGSCARAASRATSGSWRSTSWPSRPAARCRRRAGPACRWRSLRRTRPNSRSLGYVYSFNGPHSLFVDTMRTIRILGVAWQLGHALMHENDRAADLLKRSVLHGLTTSQYILFHGDSGHTYDVRGRTAHEAIFNRNDGNFRCRATPAGLLPVQHLDARAGVGHARVRRGAGVLRHHRRRPRSRPRSACRVATWWRSTRRPPAPPATITSTT